MKVTVYDRRPGKGPMNAFLKLTWFLGCWLQKLMGKVDAYYGAESWDDAIDWLAQQPRTLTSIQYWGHGSPGTPWLAQEALPHRFIEVLAPKVTPDSVVWFRCCSVFQGPRGHLFSYLFSRRMGCTVAAHTRIIGVFQGGLYTRKPGEDAKWPVTEGEIDNIFAKWGLVWGTRTVWCFATKVPEGW